MLYNFFQKTLFLHSNCQVHKGYKVQEEINNYSFVELQHPPPL